MTAAYFEDHPTDPDKVILRKPRHDDDDDIQEYKKPWVGLTDEELPTLANDNGKVMDLEQTRRFYKVIERLLKEKNA